MVYGEYAQQPAVELCKLLASQLPTSLGVTYLTNSGTEAIEGIETAKGSLVAKNLCRTTRITEAHREP